MLLSIGSLFPKVLCEKKKKSFLRKLQKQTTYQPKPKPNKKDAMVNVIWGNQTFNFPLDSSIICHIRGSGNLTEKKLILL